MADKPQGVDIVAAREHSITSRRTRVHVIVCHNLDERAHTLYEMFRFADRVSPEVLEALTRELADDIMRDADMLIAELQRIKAFAQRELTKLPAPLRE
jgi:ferric iron reductase protein FhuF